MTCLPGPWTGLTPAQGGTLIVRAALAFKLREGRWPNTTDRHDTLLAGASWSTADHWLRTHYSSSLHILTGGKGNATRSTPAEKAAAIVAFHKANGRWPRRVHEDCEERRLAGVLGALRHKHPEVCVAYDIPLSPRPEGPWVGLTAQQAKSLILRAAKAFKLREGRWPRCRDGRDSLLNNADWAVANAYLQRVCGASLVLVTTGARGRSGRGYPWPTTLPALKALALEHGLLHKAKHGRWPSKLSGPCETLNGAPTWGAIAIVFARFGSYLPSAFGKVPRADRPNLLAGDVRAFFDTHDRWPQVKSHSSEVSAEEARLGRGLAFLRAHHKGLCEHYGIPPKADLSECRRKCRGKSQFTDLGELQARFARQWRATQYAHDIEGDSGTALNQALANDKNPSGSRGLVFALDRCQVKSISRANLEIEHDCWRFTLKGAKKPDRRQWADILASGDNKKIESAERVAFLDWENPDENAIRIVDALGRAQAPATRRPWSPPATQPEAGKPAPAKGKGKRASAK